MNLPKTILVIDDEIQIQRLLKNSLSAFDISVIPATTGAKGIESCISHRPDFIILDIGLPDISGLDVLHEIRSWSKIPIIILSAKNEEDTIVFALENGADDYVTKPFIPKILLARIKAVGRRYSYVSAQKNKFIEIRNIFIDPLKRTVKIHDKNIEMTYSEFQILYLLASKPGWVFTRSQIVNSVRGENHAITDRAVDVQIVGLRKKLGETGKLIIENRKLEDLQW